VVFPASGAIPDSEVCLAGCPPLPLDMWRMRRSTPCLLDMAGLHRVIHKLEEQYSISSLKRMLKQYKETAVCLFNVPKSFLL
jgi:hypothetical protein